MVVEPTPENITEAARIIRQGGLVVFPTETVYGLGANALDDAACRRIFEVKQRPSNNPLIVHVPSSESVQGVSVLDDRLRGPLENLSRFWPGPLTLVLPAGGKVAPAVTGGKQSVALRVPSHPVALELLKKTGVPVAAPSANISSRISATTADHVEATLGLKVDMILDGGPCRIGVESTILSLLEWPPRILRPGGITAEMLSDELKVPVATLTRSGASEEEKEPLAPGMLRGHYAPHTRLVFRGSAGNLHPSLRVGLLSFGPRYGPTDDRDYACTTVLSAESSLHEVAARLFSALYEMDKLGLDVILVDSCEEEGIGRAVMDRLRRAAYSSSSST